MIVKLPILIGDKIVTNKFKVIELEDRIIIEEKINIIRVPIYNKFVGLDYVPISFPLELYKLSDELFNPFIIFSSWSEEGREELDFFSALQKQINRRLLTFNELVERDLLVPILKTGIKEKLEFLSNENLLSLVTNLWCNINLIELIVFYILTKHTGKINKEIGNKYSLSKKLLSIVSDSKNIQYDLFNINKLFNYQNYYNFNYNNKLKLNDLKVNNIYYIFVKKQIKENSIDKKTELEKYIQIQIQSIKLNQITLCQGQNLIFENYTWHKFPPFIKPDKSSIIYLSYKNNKFQELILSKLLNIESIHSEKILEYYWKEKNLSNLIILKTIFENLNEELSNVSLLKNTYSNNWFEFIVQKANKEEIVMYLSELFNKYNYPLNFNRHELDIVFDHILYISLYHYKTIITETKNDVLLLIPEILNIVPMKIKTLYFNLIKVFIQLIKSEFYSISFNQKFYSDYLHRSIIKIFFNDNNKLSFNYVKSKVKPWSLDKFRRIIETNLLLIDISAKLNWATLPKKLNYLDVFYKNDELIFFKYQNESSDKRFSDNQDNRINRNIMPENLDPRIKKIIENPWSMYSYLRKEKDFIRWTKFITNKINSLYLVPISFSSEDMNYLGKLIYLLFNIKEQNIKEQTYINFINFSNQHPKLIISSNRINMKIKEIFPNLKTSLNLGILAKNLTMNKDTVSLKEEKEKSKEVLELELKLSQVIQKYYKYKTKYMESKGLIENVQHSETSNFTGFYGLSVPQLNNTDMAIESSTPLKSETSIAQSSLPSNTEIDNSDTSD